LGVEILFEVFLITSNCHGGQFFMIKIIDLLGVRLSNDITGFKVNSDNSFTISNNGIAGKSGLTPFDIVSSPDSRYVYTLNTQSKSIRLYKVNTDGLLSVESDRLGLPAYCTSIAIK
jgi:6-phosphogluconolactonase (cycloisomerase 2 family)